MTDPTRVPSGGHDYTPELLALAIVEAELRNDMGDRRALIAAAVAEHPERVIDTLANLLTCEYAEYGDHAFCQTEAVRWAILDPRAGA